MHYHLLTAIEDGQDLEKDILMKLDDIMRPFDENSSDSEHLEFQDVTEEYHNEYLNTTRRCVRMPGGEIESMYDSPVRYLHSPNYMSGLARSYVIKDGLVYQTNYGKSKTLKRTKTAKKMKVIDVPFTKLYDTFEIFMDEYLGISYDFDKQAYGYYINPYGYWDWYVVGGRWDGSFLVKDSVLDHAAYTVHNLLTSLISDSNTKKIIKGYKWVNIAYKKDIEWNIMRDLLMLEMVERYAIAKDPTKTPDHLLLPEMSYETFCENELGTIYGPIYPVTAHSILYPMGHWFSSDYNTMEEFEDVKNDFIDTLPDNYLLVSVDCHV